MLLLLGTAGSACAQSPDGLVRKGNSSYEGKKYDQAELSYRKALEKKADNPAATFNLGDALYMQGKYDEANQHFGQLEGANLTDKQKAALYHNLGNTHLQKEKYEESIGAYKQALKLNPSDDDTRYNLAYAQAKLKKQQQQEQESENKQQDKNDQKSEKPKDQQQQQKEQNKQDQQDQKQSGDPGENKEKQDQQPAKPQEKQISKDEAQRILDALKNDEQDLQKKLRRIDATPSKSAKNW